MNKRLRLKRDLELIRAMNDGTLLTSEIAKTVSVLDRVSDEQSENRSTVVDTNKIRRSAYPEPSEN